MARYPELPIDAKAFIYNSTASYPTIFTEVKRRWGRAISKSTISYHKKGSPFRSLRYNAAGSDHDISRLTDWEKGYVVGFFTGDGSTCKPPSSQYRVVRFYLHRKEHLLAQHLMDILKKANLRPHLICPSSKNVLILEVGSKTIYEMICQYITWEDHRKVYTVKLRSVCELSPKFIEGFIGGVADSDGGIVGLHRWYQFASVSKELIKQLQEIFVSFKFRVNVRTYLRKSGNRKPIHLVSIPIGDAKKFSIKLNPS